ncbi:hypothetical protein [Paenibacillus larvae]|uniref:Uncharacterized protein n=1 Tax=Paenibacillus larvae subsp. larvae DSM 25430 TaxID=697284 RepID=V9W163_9BACL|nr:hypothetical protein [Paenibacillus larvae]AHD04721.1 hypothetical protein ERIC2_c08880 [Paenibacillus larvae subsp. larvae DSM 25430]MDR5566946.1 hypothetical protein [Paenibacillus larvae]MDR5595059.1 hypothetical protein [Paenibacillus larvae]
MKKSEKDTENKKPTFFDYMVVIMLMVLMFLFIFAIPFFIFYGMVQLVSLTPYVSINSSSTLESLITVLNFFIITVVTIFIADISLYLIIEEKKGIFNLILEGLLMFVVMYLYVLIYSLYSKDIVIKDIGVAIVSLSLFVLYLLIHVVDFVTEKLKNKHRSK